MNGKMPDNRDRGIVVEGWRKYLTIGTVILLLRVEGEGRWEAVMSGKREHFM